MAIFLKKKFKKKIKNSKKIKKKLKLKKKQRLTRGKVVNGVCKDLTKGTTLMHITNLGTKLRQSSKWVPF